MLTAVRVAVAGLLLAAATLAHAAEPRLLSDPATSRNADRAVILLHGLMGSADESFGDWPAIIGNDDTDLSFHGKMRDLAVYSIGYEADFLAKPSLDTIAVGVAQELAASQVFRRHRHVWIVAHSMGGVILKRVVTLWVQEEKHVLIDRIMGIAILGAPSSGSPLADLAREYGLDSVAGAFGWNADLVRELASKQNNSYLDSLETDWMTFRSTRAASASRRFTPLISCAHEEKPQFAGNEGWGGRLWDAVFGPVWRYFAGPDIESTVVPKLYSEKGCNESRHFSVRHTELVKPVDANDERHVWLRAMIDKSIRLGAQERRFVLTTPPPGARQHGRVAFNVLDLVDMFNDDRETPDLHSGIPVHPERFAFRDQQSQDRASRLVLRSGEFAGSTMLRVWQEIARKNTCIQVSHSVNRLEIELAVEGETTQCRGGAEICQGLRCD